jgi:hypothetical protein
VLTACPPPPRRRTAVPVTTEGTSQEGHCSRPMHASAGWTAPRRAPWPRCSAGWPRASARCSSATVRPRPGGSSARSVSRSNSGLCGAVVWARGALNSPKRRFSDCFRPGRAGTRNAALHGRWSVNLLVALAGDEEVRG